VRFTRASHTATRPTKLSLYFWADTNTTQWWSTGYRGLSSSLSFVIRLDYFRIVVNFDFFYAKIFLQFGSNFLYHKSHFRERTANASSGIHRLILKTIETKIQQGSPRYTEQSRHELDVWLTRGEASQRSHQLHDPRKLHVVEIHRHSTRVFDYN